MGEAFLLSANGSVLTHADPAFLPSEAGMTVLSDVIVIDLDAPGVQRLQDRDGTAQYLDIATVDRTGWWLGVTQPVAAIVGQITRNLLIDILINVVILAVSLVLLSVRIRQLLSPLVGLKDSLIRLSQGDFSAKVEAGAREDEIGVLQNAAAELNETLTNLVHDMDWVLGRMAACDLTACDIQPYPGDFDKLTRSVNDILGILRQLISQVQDASTVVSSGAEQVSGSAQALAQSSAEQNGSIQQLAGEASKISQGLSRTAQYAQSAKSGTTSTYESIQQCSAHMTQMI